MARFYSHPTGLFKLLLNWNQFPCCIRYLVLWIDLFRGKSLTVVLFVPCVCRKVAGYKRLIVEFSVALERLSRVLGCACARTRSSPRRDHTWLQGMSPLERCPFGPASAANPSAHTFLVVGAVSPSVFPFCDEEAAYSWRLRRRGGCSQD